MTTEAEIQEALDTVEAVILREQEAEQRGTTRFSRLPGLYAERDRLKYEIALENEPRDRAYALAAEISRLPNSDRLAVAARLRELDPYLAVAATADSAPAGAPLPGAKTPMNIYRFQFISACPANKQPIVYRAEIRHEEMVFVEHILTAVRLIPAGYHEDIADELHRRFGGLQEITADHHGVEISTIRGPL